MKKVSFIVVLLILLTVGSVFAEKGDLGVGLGGGEMDVRTIYGVFGITDRMNIEVRIDFHNRAHLIEVAPRFGGNLIPKTISYATGINLIKLAFSLAIGYGRKVSLYVS